MDSLSNASIEELTIRFDYPKSPPLMISPALEQRCPSMRVKKTFLDTSADMYDTWGHVLRRSASSPASLSAQVGVENTDSLRQEQKAVSDKHNEVASHDTPLGKLFAVMPKRAAVEESVMQFGQDLSIAGNVLIYNRDMCGQCGTASRGFACCNGQDAVNLPSLDTSEAKSLQEAAKEAVTLCQDCGRSTCWHGLQGTCNNRKCKWCHCHLPVPIRAPPQRQQKQKKKVYFCR